MNKYYLSALTAFIIWFFFSLILKPMHIYPPMDILFYRVFMASSMMILAIAFNPVMRNKNINTFKQLSLKEKKASIFYTLSGSVLITSNWFFFIQTMNNISIKAASYAYLVCPILTTVLAYFILGEKITKVKWLAVFLSIVSCVILAYNHITDLIYSMVIAVSYAFYLITQRKNVHLDKFFILAIQLVFAAICMLPFFPFYVQSTSYSYGFYFDIFLIAAFFTILPLWLNLYALKGVPSATIGIMIYINPLLNFTLAYFFFHEMTSASQWIAYAIILLSIIIFNWNSIFKSA